MSLEESSTLPKQEGGLESTTKMPPPSTLTSTSTSTQPPRPAPPPLPPRDALQVLLHTTLTLLLTDRREITGTLSAIDKHSVLLSQARETRVLAGEVGENVARYYPFSRCDRAEQQGMVRVRDISSVLVRFEDLVEVRMGEQEAADWGRLAGVEWGEGGRAV